MYLNAAKSVPNSSKNWSDSSVNSGLGRSSRRRSKQNRLFAPAVKKCRQHSDFCPAYWTDAARRSSDWSRTSTFKYSGGCCSFDLPTLHIWLHLAQSYRDAQVETWLASLNPLNQALSLVLDLIRNSAPFRKQTSLNGFYQDNGEDADLLRLQLPLDSQLYPQISGHKSRFAIRFMPLDSENGQVPERLDFELACC